MTARRRRRVAALALTVLTLGAASACSDDGGQAATSSNGNTTIATTTTLPDAAFSSVALEDAAIAYGTAMLDEDAGAVHDLMTDRCKALVSEPRLAAVMNLILRAMERQQGVLVEDVRVVGALTGEIVDGHGEAGIQLNEEIFDEPEFAFLDMQRYVFEEGEWRNDACDAMAAGDNPAEDFRDPTE